MAELEISNAKAAAKPAPRWLEIALPLLAALAAAAVVWRTQPALAARAYESRVGEETVLLPPADQLVSMSLGHRAAMVDYLWGKTLVEYGIHASEKRPLEIERYLDAVGALEPEYAPLYLFGDTLLAYRPPRGYAEDARKARLLLKRGTEARPNDPQIWMHFGQFCAFMPQTFLTDEREIDGWRREGADAMARAVELGADADRSLAATSMMRRYGEKDAAIKHLQRAWAITDDERTRMEIAARLQILQANVDGEGIASRWDASRRANAPFVKPALYKLIGPMLPAARCVGIAASHLPECSRQLDAP